MSLLIFVLKNSVAVASSNNFNKSRFVSSSSYIYNLFISSIIYERSYFVNSLKKNSFKKIVFRWNSPRLWNFTRNRPFATKIKLLEKRTMRVNPTMESNRLKPCSIDVIPAAMLTQSRARHELWNFSTTRIKRGVAECRHDKSCETRRGWAVPGSLKR